MSPSGRLKIHIIKVLSLCLVLTLVIFPDVSQAKGKYPSSQSGVTSALIDCSKKILIPANADNTQNWKLINSGGFLNSPMMTRAVQSYTFYKNRIASCAAGLNSNFQCGDAPVGEVCQWSADNPTGMNMDLVIQKYFAGLKNKYWCIAAGYTTSWINELLRLARINVGIGISI